MSAANNRRRSARQWFADCAAAYAAQFFFGVDFGNNVTRRGSCFHAARANYISLLWDARLADDTELAADALRAALVTWPVPMAEELDVRDLFSRWIERFSLNLNTFFAVETELECFGTTMRFDYVEADRDTLTIDDAKSSWHIPSAEALETDFQCAMYLAAARKLFPGFRRYVFRWDFVRFNQFRTVEKTDAELDEIEDMLSAQDAAMDAADKSGQFTATGGSHCARCMVPHCHVADNALRYPNRTESPASVIEELAALHRAVELRQSWLRALVNERGPQSAGNIEWANRPSERSVYPAQAVLDVLESTGTEFKLHFSGSAVKPLISSKKKYKGPVEDGIKAVAITHTRTQFGPKVVVESDEREYQESDE